MARSSSTGLALTILAAAFLGQSSVRAQAPAAAPPPDQAPTKVADYNPLPDLPRPLDAPRTLLLPPPAAPTAEGANLPGPYFDNNPLYNDPKLPPAGWYTAAEVDGVIPHIKDSLTGLVPFGNLGVAQVSLPNAPLDFTAAPKITLGYRLPSGFGEFALSWKGFSTQGSDIAAGPDGPAALTSRLDVNQIDLDYLSREYSLWPNWEMTWNVGLRVSTVYYDSTMQESFAEAAAGSALFQQHASNSYWGVGPNAGLSLERHIGGTYLSFLTKVDATNLIGRVSQHFNATSTFADASGNLIAADSRYNATASVPVVNFQAGINWTPPQIPYSSVFVGYVYEYWWDLGRDSNNPGSIGEMSNQGIVLRTEFHF
jgi:Legionella pneumophila major outer membrane protein precursor